MRSKSASYHGYRFPPDIISHAVWLYYRFCLSFRDAEDLLAQRGVTVTYETIRQWCQRFGPVYARQLRRRRGRMGLSCYHCTVARPSTRWSVPAPCSCIWNSELSRRSASTPICRFSRPCSRTPTP